MGREVVVFPALDWTGRDWAAYILMRSSLATINIHSIKFENLINVSSYRDYAGWELTATKNRSKHKAKYTIVPLNLHF
jgi:hypothetical protein